VEDKTMSRVTIGIASPETVKERVRSGLRGEPQGKHISFASIDLLWKVLTLKRWDILKLMTGAGPLTIREIARRAGRDVKAVHADIHALLSAGLLDKDDTGKIEFPHDSVHVDFMLVAA
jgi:predicted transcriptional regulator